MFGGNSDGEFTTLAARKKLQPSDTPDEFHAKKSSRPAKSLRCRHVIRETAAVTDRKFGGASRDRTDDLIVANDALSQLSYSPLPVGRNLINSSSASRFEQNWRTGKTPLRVFLRVWH